MISSKRTCLKCSKNVVEACCHKLLNDQGPAPPTEQGEDTEFTKACSQGNAKVVGEFIKNGVDVEKRNKNGYTPLMSAVSGNHVDCVKILLTCACVNAVLERTKDTALSMAAAAGHEEIVSILVKANANIEHRNGGDYTPLALAASGGHVNVMETLITAGAHVDAMTESKMRITPLMMAAMNGKEEAVKRLLQYGADMHVQIEGNKNTALQLAAAKGRTGVVKLLLEEQNIGRWKPGSSTKPSPFNNHFNLEHRNGNGYTALMEAAREGHVEIGRLLLHWGGDPNTVAATTARDTALSFAAEKGPVEFVESLLDCGAYINAQVRKNCTPLWIACCAGNADVVKLLIEHEADVNQPDARGVTPLMIAFKKGHVDVVQGLVKHVARLHTVVDLDKYLQRPEMQKDNELRRRCLDCMQVIIAEQMRQESQALKAQQSLLKQLENEEHLAKKRQKSRIERKQPKAGAETEDNSEQASTEDRRSLVSDDYISECEDEEEESEVELEAKTPSVTTSESESVAIPSQFSDFDIDCYFPSSFESHAGEWVNTSEIKKKKSAAAAPLTKPAPLEVQSVPDNGAKVLKLTSSQIGRVIGRAGANINKIRDATSASIDVQKVSNRPDGLRTVTVKGGPRAVSKAVNIIDLMLKEHEIDVDTVIVRVDRTQRGSSTALVDPPKPRVRETTAVPKKTIIVPAPNPPPFQSAREESSDNETWIIEDNNPTSLSPFDDEPRRGLTLGTEVDDREQLSRLLSQMMPVKNGLTLPEPIAPPRVLQPSSSDFRCCQSCIPSSPFQQPSGHLELGTPNLLQRRSAADPLGISSLPRHGMYPGPSPVPSPFDTHPRNPFDDLHSPLLSMNYREDLFRHHSPAHATLPSPFQQSAPSMDRSLPSPFHHSTPPLDSYHTFAPRNDFRFPVAESTSDFIRYQSQSRVPPSPFQQPPQQRRPAVDPLGITSVPRHGAYPDRSPVPSPFATNPVTPARNPFDDLHSPLLSVSMSYRDEIDRILGADRAEFSRNPWD
ncbi:hypothetical protein QR680_011518 [Steinernema hermaphroditum]|uniref:K Homology domain-containing protein n=1 Tax=Steinernema hermaphroditum TaxID=289476 RepID=A0AA39I0B4_9BILA|nr:hypothetical protein QR680_011518 [Steinernema hermaphroditum]